VRVKILGLALCSLFLFSHPVIYAAITEVKTPFLELQPDSIELTPMQPKVGPGGEGEITITIK
jgi:hypothetical protein